MEGHRGRWLLLQNPKNPLFAASQEICKLISGSLIIALSHHQMCTIVSRHAALTESVANKRTKRKKIVIFDILTP